MATKLVIVESPAKARTIGGYLGSDYEVMASVGHIRDLPKNGKGLPNDLQKKWWADYAVDIDNGFEPIYEVTPDSTSQVKRLRDAMKGKVELVLATDEDREGEAISWHLLQVLKPSKSVQVKRIAFHEITKGAIQAAIAAPRQIDQALVEAQETRRILDRLYGYTLSPVLWRKVARGLSAGRVQSPAVKLIVEREVARRKFKVSSYWDLQAKLASGQQSFPAELRSIDGQRVATGSDFDDESGELKEPGKVRLLDEEAASALADAARAARPWTVSSVDSKEGVEKPHPPFMTTTLQQEANRKFGFSADRTMKVAQSLYEGVSIGTEQVGLITYMRTDSLALSTQAIQEIRALIAKEYKDCLPDRPVPYTSKVRNAQEAHEAIRPTEASRRPSELRKYLTEDQSKLYDLIWKRTIACQMKPAKVLRTEVEIQVQASGQDLRLRASGKQILFEGYQRVYIEDADDPEAELEGRERRLPKLSEGLELDLESLAAVGHETKPPARYTEATLIKKLEEMGIGRPSTYASIMNVIVEGRGYVRKSGKQLIPTFLAFLAMDVLEAGFEEFMRFDFTKQMNDDLDLISEGKQDPKAYLSRFFLGDGKSIGLKQAVDERKLTIPFPDYPVGTDPESGKDIVIRLGKEGDAFLQLGPKEDKKFANVPEDMAPADITVEWAMAQFERRVDAPESIGVHPTLGRRLLLRQRGSYYLEVERTDDEIERKEKPTWVSLPPGADPRALSQDDLNALCSLPRVLGKSSSGEEISFQIGKYGPYVRGGKEIRNVDDWRLGLTMTLEEAEAILAQPKFGRAKREPAKAIQEFGQFEGAAGPVRVLPGRFGPYITDGATNVTVPKGTDPSTLSVERAKELLDAKRAAGPSARPSRGRKPARMKKTPAGRRKSA